MTDRNIRYDYGPVPTIKRFSESSKFIRGLMGPFGSGKSTGCIFDLVGRALDQAPGPDGIRNTRFAIIRNTYPQLCDTSIRTVHDWLPPELFGTWRASDHNYVLDRLHPGIRMELCFRALDRPEHVANLLSAEYTGAWVNEAREVPKAVINALPGRVGRYPAVKDGGCTWAGIIMDTNPPDTDSWWYEMFEERRPENAELFRQPSGLSESAENIPNLRAGYYQNLLQTMDESEIAVYVRGEYGFTRDGKPVYPEYSDNAHCIELEPNQKVKTYRGWDFGLTPSVVFSQILPDGRWLTFDELCADNLGIERFGEAVTEHIGDKYPWMKDAEDIGDPSGTSGNVGDIDARSCFDILEVKGFRLLAGDQAPTIRIGSVKKALNTMLSGKPRVIVHPRCKMLRKGYQGRYMYKRIKVAGAAERFHDAPDKNEYSHPHDANQYVAAKLFGASLKSSGEKPKPIKYPTKRRA